LFTLQQKPEITHKLDVPKSDMSVGAEKFRGAGVSDFRTVTATLICESVWHFYFWFINGALRSSEHTV
jgi:hypothetical protein